MNAKLNMQQLVDLMAERNGTTKKSEEHFLKEFFALIQEGLLQDSYVKIKGFGTFKLMEVENRSSIDINTGKPIDIEGHTKVSFTPENELKELINKPFSNFENVILKEETILENTMVEESMEEVKAPEVFQEDVAPAISALVSEPLMETQSQSNPRWIYYTVGILLLILIALGIIFLVL